MYPVQQVNEVSPQVLRQHLSLVTSVEDNLV